MFRIKRDGYNGRRNDHYSPRQRRATRNQWVSLTAREYEAAPKVEIQGVPCGVRRTFEAHRPFRFIRPAGETFSLLDGWAHADGTIHVRVQFSNETLAIFQETDDGLVPVCPAPVCPAEEATYTAAAQRHREIESLLAEPLPPCEREQVLTERKQVQRQMSHLSFAELYARGIKAYQDGADDAGLSSRVRRVQALENQTLSTALSAAQREWIQDELLPNCQNAVVHYVLHMQRHGRL